MSSKRKRRRVRQLPVTLFPQAWQGSGSGGNVPASDVDVPWDDPGLLRFVTAACPAAGIAIGLVAGANGTTGRGVMPSQIGNPLHSATPLISHFAKPT